MQALVRGYATVSTDNGHQSTGFDVSWALGQPERVIDFGYRAQHMVTHAAKELTRRYYGRAPRHSYFVGCSQGGHHGLMEAERFPEDYDGIIAGAPVYNWAGEMAEQAWNVRALQQTPTGALPKQKLQILYDAVVKACGSPDGAVADPRQSAALGSARVKEFYRLFMIPGMGHCSAGPDVLFRSENATAIPLEPDRDINCFIHS